MNEDFLHYIWKYRLFSFKEVKTTEEEELIVLKPGNHNMDSGPDFLNSHLKINQQTWIGNIEIHVNASDWYIHNHEQDENYDAVILHVVWQKDAEVFMKNNRPIPTLELKNIVDVQVYNNYQNLFSKQLCWVACEPQIASVDKFLVNNWLERLYFERLERKSKMILELLKKSNNDYEAVLFWLLAKNFGLKVNGEAFLSLAQSLDFSVVRKERFDEKKLGALLFGQAGFLEKELEEEYYISLKTEYKYLQHKHKLKGALKNQFQFFRMRPNNFPTIRIAQLVSLFHVNSNLFSKLMAVNNIEDFYTLFSIDVNDFWKEHYTFETTSKKSVKRLPKSFIDLVIINTIIPLKFVFERSKGVADESEILDIMQQLKAEKNNIISKFSDLKVKASNAFESQALLELKNNYCAVKNCLKCAIGNSLLRKEKVI